MIHKVELLPVRTKEIAHWARLTVEGLACVELAGEAEAAREFMDEPKESRQRAYLAWSGGRPVARLRLKEEGERARTWAIGLAPEARTPALRTAVVKAAEEWARGSGARQLLSEVETDMAGAFAAAGHRTQRVRVSMRARLERRPVLCELPMHHVYLAGEDEAQALARLYYESYLGTIDDEGEGPEGALAEARKTAEGEYGTFLPACSFALEREGALAGAVLVTEAEDAVLLAEVMVHPLARGRGYARPLIQAAINASLDAGWQEMILMVTLGNVPAEGLYRRMGFRPDPGCEWHYFDKDLDRDGNESMTTARGEGIS
ncbi:MAG: GNAT family N-acetyltransferase [Chloroflexi bacterium]|nr:MAG: GNAT family N-acetyltransferase [Chloroflexota bacterium]